MAASPWRLQKSNKARGVYWTLIQGSRGDRRSVLLKYVTEEQARLACTRMNAAEQAGVGAVDTVLALFASDPATAIEHLVFSDLFVAGLVAAAGPDWSRATVAEYYTNVYAPHREATARANTWKAERHCWQGRILPGLGSLPLRDVSMLDFRTWLVAQIAVAGPRKGEHLSGNSRRLIRAAMQSMLNYAYLEGRHLSSHVKLSSKDCPLPGTSKTVRARRAPLNRAELRALMAALAKGAQIGAERGGTVRRASGQGRALVGLGAGNGLRPSELARVRWEDIDFAAGTIYVRGEKTDDSAATIPLTPIGLEALQTWHAQCDLPSSGYCFVTRAGKPYGRSGFKCMLANAAARAGISDPKKVTPYLLRSTFATIAFVVGLDKEYTRRIGRWTDTKMLDRIYARPDAADWRDQLSAVRL